MSRNLATNCGSLDSLNRRTRCGCRPCARQMRCTELTLMPTALAMAAPVQWVAFGGGPDKVKVTTRSTTSGGSGGIREGRVLSRHSPATPSAPNRSCQRQMTVLAFPVRRMISALPRPSAVRRMILARQTYFCGLFRLPTTASNSVRSAALNLIWALSCIPQTRMIESAGESAKESKCQIWPTRCHLDLARRAETRVRGHAGEGDAAVRGQLWQLVPLREGYLSHWCLAKRAIRVGRAMAT